MTQHSVLFQTEQDAVRLLTDAIRAAGGPQRLRRFACRFAGMVEPGDTVTFSAEPTEPGRLQVRAVNQHGDVILTKAYAEFEPGLPPLDDDDAA